MNENMIEIDHVDTGSIDRVRLVGRLGAAVTNDVAAELVGIVDRGHGILHLDLAELEFLDSAGLSSLVTLLKHARKQEGDVVLVNVNDRVRSLLELTRLHEIFELLDDPVVRTASGSS